MSDKSPTLTCTTQPPSSQPEEPHANHSATLDFGGAVEGTLNNISNEPSDFFGGGTEGGDFDIGGWGDPTTGPAIGGGGFFDPIDGSGASDQPAAMFGGDPSSGVFSFDDGIMAADPAVATGGQVRGGGFFDDRSETPHTNLLPQGGEGSGDWNDWGNSSATTGPPAAAAAAAAAMPPSAPEAVPVAPSPVASPQPSVMSQLQPQPQAAPPPAVFLTVTTPQKPSLAGSTMTSTPSTPNNSTIHSVNASPKTMARRQMLQVISPAEHVGVGTTPAAHVTTPAAHVNTSPVEPLTVEKPATTPIHQQRQHYPQQQSVGQAFRSLQQQQQTPFLINKGAVGSTAAAAPVAAVPFRQMKDFIASAKELSTLLDTTKTNGGDGGGRQTPPSPAGLAGVSSRSKLGTAATLREARTRQSHGEEFSALVAKDSGATLAALGPHPALGALVLNRSQVPLPYLLPKAAQLLHQECDAVEALLRTLKGVGAGEESAAAGGGKTFKVKLPSDFVPVPGAAGIMGMSLKQEPPNKVSIKDNSSSDSSISSTADEQQSVPSDNSSIRIKSQEVVRGSIGIVSSPNLIASITPATPDVTPHQLNGGSDVGVGTDVGSAGEEDDVPLPTINTSATTFITPATTSSVGGVPVMNEKVVTHHNVEKQEDDAMPIPPDSCGEATGSQLVSAN